MTLSIIVQRNNCKCQFATWIYPVTRCASRNNPSSKRTHVCARHLHEQTIARACLQEQCKYRCGFRRKRLTLFPSFSQPREPAVIGASCREKRRTRRGRNTDRRLCGHVTRMNRIRCIIDNAPRMAECECRGADRFGMRYSAWGRGRRTAAATAAFSTPRIPAGARGFSRGIGKTWSRAATRATRGSQHRASYPLNLRYPALSRNRATKENRVAR